MGINGAHELSHSVKGLSLQDLYKVCLYIRQQRFDDTKPIIDLDASLIYRGSKLSVDNRMRQMMDICSQLSSVGFNVVVICDGSVRHHTKRASIQRQSRHFENKVNSYLLRAKLMGILELKKSTIDATEKGQLEGEEDLVSGEIKLLERKIQFANVDVGDPFFLSLIKHINKLSSLDLGNNDGSVTVIQAEFQADSVLAYRQVNKISDLVFSSDSDLLAHCGPLCLGIKNYNYVLRGKKAGMDNIELFTACDKMLTNICEALRLPCNDKNIKRTPNAVFDGIDCPKTRALIAIGLGCDVYHTGIRGISKVVLREWLDVNKKNESDMTRSLYDKLIEFYAIRSSCNNTRTKKMTHTNAMSTEDRQFLERSLNILVDAFLFEPCNFQDSELQINLQSSKPIYIHNRQPTSLHVYLQDFRKQDLSINLHGDITDCTTCVGIGKGPHMFLTFEGSVNCVLCNATCCQYCKFSISKDITNYCATCYMNSKFIPSQQIEEHVPIEEMVLKLHKVGMEVNKDNNLEVLLALYDRFVTKKMVVFDDATLNSCTMPFETSEFLSNENVLFNFNFKEGGFIVRNHTLSTDDKLALISLLAKLVIVKPNKANRQHAAVPYYLVEVANASRLRGGDRLLGRALRHSVDNDRTEIYNADARIVRYKSMIGMTIVTKVRASMKNTHYNVTVSFCESGIIANTCTCKVGCLGVERIICIHVLPVIQQLSYEIYTRLASEILYAFNQEWDPFMESNISRSQQENLKSDIVALIRAANRQAPKSYNDINSVSELLQIYDTGTEQRKSGPGPPTCKSLLGPLRTKLFENPILSAINIMTCKNTGEDGKEENIIYVPLQPKEDIPYLRILNMVKYIREKFPKENDATFDDSVGYKVLGLRASKSGSLLSVLDTDTKNKIDILLDAGNVTYRGPRLRNKIVDTNVSDGASINADENVDCRIFDEDNNENVINENNNENVSDMGNENDNTDVNKKRNKKQYHQCCVPECPKNQPNTYFKRLPACPPKNLKNASNKVRLTYAIKSFKRKEWLRRFQLTESQCPFYVLYCSNHLFENTEVEIKWKSKDGLEKCNTSTIMLPKDNNESGILTRAERLIRKPVIPMPPNIRKPVIPMPPNIRIGRPPLSNLSTNNNQTKYKPPDHWCCYVNCDRNSNMPNIRFTRVPPIPPHPPSATSNNTVRYNYAKRVAYRAEYLRRIGAPANDTRIDMRICNNHQVERLSKSMTYETLGGTTNTTTITIDVPSAFSIKSNLNQHSEIRLRRNKGNAYHRFENNYVEKSRNMAEVRKDLSWSFALYETLQSAEEQTYRDNESNSTTAKKRKIMYGIVEKQPKKKVRQHEKTVVQISSHSNFVLTACTGFRSMSSMLSFICLVCNGDIDLMMETRSSLTWIEEWHFYFERVYGRSVTRMVDCCLKYILCDRLLLEIFVRKLELVILARRRWPMFVSLDEDVLLRKPAWDATYSGLRIVMWDNTDVRLATPSHPNLQRNTYSDYYGKNVGKGSVFVQLCGWMGTHELWEGAVSDTDYFRRSGILQIQKQYMHEYDAETRDTKFTIILDRGYKVTGECFAVDGQQVLQPTFSKPGEPKFSGRETQLTAAVAADRGANERAVRLAKLSRYIKDGYKHTVSLEQLCDVWLAWSFQVNFIYKPVL